MKHHARSLLSILIAITLLAVSCGPAPEPTRRPTEPPTLEPTTPPGGPEVTAEAFVDTYGFTAFFTGDPDYGVIAVHDNGEQLIAMTDTDASGNVTRVKGAILISPDGDSLVVYNRDDGLPDRAVFGENLALFQNYGRASVTVRIVTAEPGWPSDYREDVPVDPEALRELQAQGPRAKAVASLAMMSASEETLSLSKALRVAALTVSVTGCALGQLWACAGVLVTAALSAGGEDLRALEGAEDVVHLAGCLATDYYSCVSLAINNAANVVDAATEFIESKTDLLQQLDIFRFLQDPEVVSSSEYMQEDDDQEEESPRTEEPLPTELEVGPVQCREDCLAIVTEDGELWVMAMDGSDAVKLGAGKDPDWSPDGTQLAFVSAVDGQDDVFVMDIASGGVSRLTKDPSADNEPCWSPDGTQLAFVTGREGASDIYVMSADGTGAHRLSPDETRQNRSPDWSPRNDRLAFIACDDWVFVYEGRSYCQVMVMDLDDRSIIRVTELTTDSGHPSWSQDGALLVFDAARVRNKEPQLWLWPDDRCQHPYCCLTGDHDSEYEIRPTFLGESQNIAYLKAHGLYQVSTTDRSPTVLLEQNRIIDYAVQP